VSGARRDLLHRLWRDGDPLLFLLAWTAATGGSMAWVALVPGRPEYRYDGQMQAAVAGGVLVLFFLLRRSPNARRLAMFAALFGIVAGAFGTLTPGGAVVEWKFLGLVALQAVALAALASPPFERYVGVTRPTGEGRVDER
jgi:hypothetical protein